MTPLTRSEFQIPITKFQKSMDPGIWLLELAPD